MRAPGYGCMEIYAASASTTFCAKAKSLSEYETKIWDISASQVWRIWVAHLDFQLSAA